MHIQSIERLTLDDAKAQTRYSWLTEKLPTPSDLSAMLI